MESLIFELIQYIILVSGSFSSDLGYDSQLIAPWDQDLIRIEYRSQQDLNAIYWGQHSPEGTVLNVQGLQFGSLVFLLSSWDKNSVKDQSILLHELVHVLQDETGIDYSCNGDRERLAYYIQEKWLLEVHGWSQQQFYSEVIHPLVMVAAMTCRNPNLARPGEGGP